MLLGLTLLFFIVYYCVLSRKKRKSRPLAALAFMVFTQLYSPCVTALGTIKKEAQSWKWMAFAFLYTCAVAWVASMLVYQVGRLLGF